LAYWAKAVGPHPVKIHQSQSQEENADKSKGGLMKVNEQLKQVALTWFRAAAAAAIALFLAGETDLKTLGLAALTGFLGPALKYLDPSAPEFGRKKK
jgi:hypothetical protein